MVVKCGQKEKPQGTPLKPCSDQKEKAQKEKPQGIPLNPCSQCWHAGDLSELMSIEETSHGASYCEAVVELLWSCCGACVELWRSCCGAAVELLYSCCGAVVQLLAEPLWSCCGATVELPWSGGGAVELLFVCGFVVTLPLWWKGAKKIAES